MYVEQNWTERGGRMRLRWMRATKNCHEILPDAHTFGFITSPRRRPFKNPSPGLYAPSPHTLLVLILCIWIRTPLHRWLLPRDPPRPSRHHPPPLLEEIKLCAAFLYPPGSQVSVVGKKHRWEWKRKSGERLLCAVAVGVWNHGSSNPFFVAHPAPLH